MKQTEHYGLNQWDLEDRIKMEDFNRDNARLEAALTALAAGGGGTLEVIGLSGSDINATSSGISISHAIDDWNEWNMVALLSEFHSFVEGSDRYVTHVLNPSCGVQFNTTSASSLYLFTPWKDGTRLVSGLLLSKDCVRFFRGTKTFQEVERLNVRAYPSGTTLGPQTYAWFGIH